MHDVPQILNLQDTSYIPRPPFIVFFALFFTILMWKEEKCLKKQKKHLKQLSDASSTRKQVKI